MCHANQAAVCALYHEGELPLLFSYSQPHLEKQERSAAVVSFCDFCFYFWFFFFHHWERENSL